MSPEDRADFTPRLERAKRELRQMGDAANPTGRERMRLLAKATGVALALSYLREYPEDASLAPSTAPPGAEHPPADHPDGSGAGGASEGEGGK